MLRCQGIFSKGRGVGHLPKHRDNGIMSRKANHIRASYSHMDKALQTYYSMV